MPETSARRLALLTAALTLAATAMLPTTAPNAHAAMTSSQPGVGLTSLAVANVGNNACSINSAGGKGFDTSCTGNSGNPEAWSGDFVAWDWANEGMTTSGLTTTAGGATAATILKYGQNDNTVHTATSYQPQPGDAIIFDNDSDYVSLVTAVNPDRSLQTAAGDWGQTISGQPAGPANTVVDDITIPDGQTAVGDQPSIMAGKTIAEYVSPDIPSTYNPHLTPFGTYTWTPPGATTARTDIYAADAYGFLWDFTHTASTSNTALSTPTEIEHGWTHYREVGVANMTEATTNYPDLVAIDTTTNNLDVFLDSAAGFATTPTQIGEGWSSKYLIFGVADWQNNGHEGIVTADLTTGDEWYYPDDLVTGAQPQIQIGTGWTNNYVPFGIGDITSDNHNGILVCNQSTNQLDLYLGDLSGGAPVSPYPDNVYDVLNGCTSDTSFGLTDYLGDGHPDLIVRDNTGNIIVNPGPGALGTASSDGTVILPDSTTPQGLTPFGAITWTPPGSTTPRVDIYAADSSGTLWDYTETPANEPTIINPLGTPTQLATGWTHYREVGVANMSETPNGYPDLVVIDTTTNNLDVFATSATGLSSTATQIGEGWASNYRPYGVADWDHTGHLGIIAADLNTGDEWYYPDDLITGAQPRQQIGSGFTSTYNPVGIAQLIGDSHNDTLLCRNDLNAVMLFAGDGSGGANYDDGTLRLTGCTNDTIFGLTDYNGDNQPDLIARDNTTGNIVVLTGITGGWWTDDNTTTITTGW